MWRRMQTRPKDGPVIGNPALLQTTFDEDDVRNISSVGARQYDQNDQHDQYDQYDRQVRANLRYTSGNSAEPQDRGKVKTLPLLPFETQTSEEEQLQQQQQQQEQQHQRRPPSEIPTASSIYSQLTPQLIQQTFQDRTAPDGLRSHSPLTPPTQHSTSGRPTYVLAPPDPDDVSPPHTPSGDDAGSEGRVSPIEEDTGARTWQKRMSHIPVPRKPVGLGREVSAPKTGRFNVNVDVSQTDGSKPERVSVMTKWDDFASYRDSGARRVQRKSYGAVAQPNKNMSPAESPELTATPLAERSGVKASFVGRMADPGRLGLAPERSTERAQWDGASERHAIVPPVVDRIRPANIPNLQPSTRKFWNTDITGHDSATASSAKAPEKTMRLATRTSHIDEVQEDIKPTPPLKAGRNSPPRQVTPTRDSQAANHPALDRSSITHASPDESATSENDFRAVMKDMYLSNQPGSRFSATTYETGSTHDSLPGSPIFGQDMPTGSGRQIPQSALDRIRTPHGGHGSSASVISFSSSISRKPAPSEKYRSSPAPSVAPSLALKSLPQSPPEAESSDLISSLEAQLDNLNHRRRNLQRILHDLQQAALPSHSNFEQRREVTRRADSRKLELAEVLAMQHEVGLKLHRAWRRKDRNEYAGEPTGLWVRRVTG